jgi:hypothetical protein
MNAINSASVSNMVPASITSLGIHEPQPFTYTDKLIFEAKKTLNNNKLDNRELIEPLDDSILIVEDEGGGLMHYEGDLSFLMADAPKMYYLFWEQMDTDMRDAYTAKQQAIWAFKSHKVPAFVSKCGRKAYIFPLHTMRQRFTVTVFHNATA